jgi:hypothetical protein
MQMPTSIAFKRRCRLGALHLPCSLMQEARLAALLRKNNKANKSDSFILRSFIRPTAAKTLETNGELIAFALHFSLDADAINLRAVIYVRVYTHTRELQERESRNSAESWSAMAAMAAPLNLFRFSAAVLS